MQALLLLTLCSCGAAKVFDAVRDMAAIRSQFLGKQNSTHAAQRSRQRQLAVFSLIYILYAPAQLQLDYVIRPNKSKITGGPIYLRYLLPAIRSTCLPPDRDDYPPCFM
jgi:hypothetical protein